MGSISRPACWPGHTIFANASPGPMLNSCSATLHSMSPDSIDAILFGLSYNTMPHHRLVLQHAWTILLPDSRIVIMDGKAPRGRMGKFFLPFGSWIMKRTLLGNPFIAPWEHLAALASDFGMEEFVFGSWYVCWGSKRGHVVCKGPYHSDRS